MLRILLFLFCLKQCYSFAMFSLNKTSSIQIFDSLDKMERSPFPEHWDLRDIDMVSPVKDQKDCGACWAFAVIANLESRLRMYKQREVILSEQYLIDCDIDQGGCQDGSIVESFAKIVTAFRGVIPEKDYPYTNGRGACIVPDRSLRFPVVGVRKVIPDEYMMLASLYLFGPLSAAINSASMKYWKYENNDVDEPDDMNCDPSHLNHAVLIVGYSVKVKDDGTKIPFWIIKNSWGTEFGHNGFYYLVRGRNACGIANDVSYPIVDALAY